MAVLLILPVFSCSRHEINSNEGDKVGEFMTFKATLGDLEEMSTRTEFQSSMTTTKWPIYWMPGDAINIFYGNKSEARFETSESFVEKGPVAEFEGYLQAATGAVADDGGTTTQNFWAVYPYNENNTCDGSSVTMTIPDEQEGKAGSFANNLNPTVACSPNMGLAFYNVGGWLVFTVSQENVVSATLQGANGETLVGKVKVSMDENNHPQVDEVTDGKTSITMTPEGGSFEVGQIYCFVILPQTFEDGVILTLEKPDGFKATCEWKPSDGSTLSVDRSKWSGKLNIDKDADFKKEGNIVFADEKVKAICVSKWDTDGDGELSYDEAAAVSEIPYGVFSGNTEITSFEEFQYFTGVTELGYKAESDEGTDYYGAFYGCTNLKAITLPSTLKTVAWGCFRECSALEYLFIPKSVTTIQQVAFLGCTSLEIHMESESPCTLQGDGTYLDGDPCAFGFPTSGKVKAIFVPNEDAASVYRSAQFWPSSLIHAEGWVDPSAIMEFEDPITEYICTSLWDEDDNGCLTYGEVQSVSDLTEMFKGAEMTSFNELKYFTSLTSLPAEAFKDCKKLVSISFPSSIESIGSDAFSGCSVLQKITIPSLQMWFDLLHAQKPLCQNGELYINGVLLTEMVIPEGTTKVDDYLCYNLGKIESIIIPEGVTQIGSYSFSGCNSLTDIVVPEGVVEIGDHAFSPCSNLTSVTLPSSLGYTNSSSSAESTGWGLSPFDCSKISRISVPTIETWFNIGSYKVHCGVPGDLYVNGKLVTDLVINEGIIPKFYYETYAKVKDYFCYNLRCIKTVSLPNDIGGIGKSSFYGCTGLSEIIIPENVTVIDESAFSNCTNLSSVSLPEGLTSINSQAFQGCSSLKTLTLPSTVTRLRTSDGYYGAFVNSGVETINCDISILEEDTERLKNSLVNESKLTSGFVQYEHYTVNMSNPVRIKNDYRPQIKEVVVTKSSTASLTYSLPSKALRKFTGLEIVTFPKGMTSIGINAFEECGSLREFDIQSTVNSIGMSSFQGCTSLTSLVIPNGVNSIASSAFRNCSSLRNINIPTGVSKIDSQLFSGCESLESMTIPENITSIGYSAFDGCSNLAIITIPETVESIGVGAFANTNLTSLYCLPVTPPQITSGTSAYNNLFNLYQNTSPDIYVPSGSEDTYKTASCWSTFANYIHPLQVVNLNGVSLPATLTIMKGTNATLTPTFTPSDATNKDVTWFSSNTSVATVDTHGKVSAIAAGTVTITVATADGGFTAACSVTVKAFPEGTSFDEDAYITYVANHQEWGNISTDQSYKCDTQFSAGVSGTRIEMKFQIPDYTSGSAILSYGSEAGLAIDASNVYYYYWQRHHEDGDTWYTEEFTPGTGGSVDGAGTVILTTSCDGNQITATVNGTGTTIPVSVSSFNVQYLFSHYDSESGDGHLYEYLAGVPDGAKLYYVKIWNGDNLVYFGHASRAVCSYTSAEEYCWYDEVGKTYTFARSLYTLTDSEITPYNPSSPIVTVRQPFGGGMD